MRVVGAAYTEFTQKIANNNDLIRAIKEGRVQAQGGSVLKEMEILMKIQEKREEERYRNLDETIRSFQHNRQMVAATREKESHKKWFRIFK